MRLAVVLIRQTVEFGRLDLEFRSQAGRYRRILHAIWNGQIVAGLSVPC